MLDLSCSRIRWGSFIFLYKTKSIDVAWWNSASSNAAWSINKSFVFSSRSPSYTFYSSVLPPQLLDGDLPTCSPSCTVALSSAPPQGRYYCFERLWIWGYIVEFIGLSVTRSSIAPRDWRQVLINCTANRLKSQGRIHGQPGTGKRQLL